MLALMISQRTKGFHGKVLLERLGASPPAFNWYLDTLIIVPTSSPNDTVGLAQGRVRMSGTNPRVMYLVCQGSDEVSQKGTEVTKALIGEIAASERSWIKNTIQLVVSKY